MVHNIGKDVSTNINKKTELRNYEYEYIVIIILFYAYIEGIIIIICNKEVICSWQITI